MCVHAYAVYSIERKYMMTLKGPIVPLKGEIKKPVCPTVGRSGDQDVSPAGPAVICGSSKITVLPSCTWKGSKCFKGYIMH